MACDDGVHAGITAAHELFKRENLRNLKNLDWFIQCDRKERFIEDCKQLQRITRTSDIADKIKKDMKYFIYHDNIPYPERLLKEINRLLTR